MINIPTFVGIVVASILGLYLIVLTPPAEDPFVVKSKLHALDLGPITQPAMATIKVRHALTQKSFHIGLFGNSRMLMVGAEALGQSSVDVFNFALSSESLDGSVMMVDNLSTLSRLPKIIVIGLDNLHLQRDNVPIWPSLKARLSHALDGIVESLKNSKAVTSLRRSWRFVWGEKVRFDMVFDPTLVRIGIARVLTVVPFKVAAPGNLGYRSDGSQEALVRSATIEQHGRTSSRLDIANLNRNLKRLGTYVAEGHTVIIVETPLYPTHQQALDVSEPDYVLHARNEWHKTCLNMDLHCVDAPMIPDALNALWFDSTHPPEIPWAEAIATAIEESKN